MNLRRIAGPDPWSIGDRMLSAKMDLGSANAHVGKPCALAGQLLGAAESGYTNRAPSNKLQASGDSTANSTRGRVEEPGAASYKLDRYSIKDYIGYYESKRSKKNN